MTLRNLSLFWCWMTMMLKQSMMHPSMRSLGTVKIVGLTNLTHFCPFHLELLQRIVM